MKNKRECGNFYEKLATEFLIKNGYTILKNNYTNSQGEIDIICKKENFIIFVEVKYRKNQNYGHPLEAVGIKKQEKIRNTSLVYISENDIGNSGIRYDVISVLGDKIEHYKNAF